ncbi:MAG: hypothetical protein IJT67_00780 [Lachnospiraceae bacterium]|nr:hypothetical protein [Lachnospiraceae bacterium]
MSQKYYSMLFGGTLTMMVVSALLMSDSIIAGMVVGSDAVAGITLVTPIYSLAAFFASLFSLGIPIIYSTEMGGFNKKEADRTFGSGLTMSLVLGVLLFLFITIFGDAYLLSTSPLAPILEQAREYLYFMRFTIMLLPLQMLISSMVYGDGDETLSTIANVVQAIGNIVASILLAIYMRTRGIGLASFLFNVISLSILLLHLLKKSNSLKINLYFSSNTLKRIIHYSIVDSGSYLFLSALIAILNYFVSLHFGGKYLILVSIVTFCHEMQMMFDGIGEAFTPITSVYLGEENHEGVRFIYRLANNTAVAEGIIIMLIMIVAAPFIPTILNIKDPELIRYATAEIRILATGSVFVSLLYLISSHYLIINKVLLGFGANALMNVVLPASLSVVFGMTFGIYGMFIGLAVAEALSYGLLYVYICIRYGRENFPLLLSEVPCSAKTYLFNLTTEPHEIINLQKKIETLLLENDVDSRMIGRVKLLIEELYMLIREKNGNKAILSECSITIKPEGIQIITKDDGVHFDVSEDDISVTSITALTVSSYMKKLDENRRHLTTMSFNRSSFLIKRGSNGTD